MLDGGRDDACPEGLGQEELGAGLRRRVPDDPVRGDETGDRHSELGLAVRDRVPADHGDPRLGGHGRTALEHAGEHLERQLVDGPRGEVEGQHGAGAHRVDVAERIRRRDPSPVVRVVDDGREEIDRLHQGLPVGQQVHGRVVAGLG